MSQVDVIAAKEIFALLHEPMLAAEERAVRLSSPALDAETVLDRALYAAILRLDFTVNHATFEHLRWKVIIHRSKSEPSIEELRVARRGDAATSERRSRTFRDGTGTDWTVTEAKCRDASGAEQPCLHFSSDSVVRRVRTLPPDWRSLSDDELLALSWSR